ncbi:GNAT family N-acetyltransferase [Aliarcobacter butzleri]|uniref:GNAT family N-acetyltransferase n=1 Tax=Aliarcobacter butzleri TaxID=28197 RepID=UPI0028CB6B58|nr:GNAT family N-acetyltransferase [Aliarcobacter butzleri]
MEYQIKKIKPYQQNQLSKILVEVYFKSYTRQDFLFPHTVRNKYLLKLKDLKKYLKKPCCNIYVAVSSNNKVLGGIFYCSDLKEYGLQLKTNKGRTSALRYLAVDDNFRGLGIGQALVQACINHAKKDKKDKIFLHTLNSMKNASKIYEKEGFQRFKHIDFRNYGFEVKGFIKYI